MRRSLSPRTEAGQVYDDGTCVYIVLELLKGGELLDSVANIRCESRI